MAETASAERTTAGSETPLKLDAAVIGAGVAGLYQLHLLRSQGLDVKAFDAASDVGGTWYWNRYPGARFDSEGYIYQYFFSEDFYKGWSWSEFPRPAGNRALDALCRRPPRPAQGHPVRHDDQKRAFRRNDGTLDDYDRQGAGHRRTVPGHLLRHVVRAAHVPFPGTGDLQGEAVYTARWPKDRSTFPANGWVLSALARPESRSSRRSPTRSAT